MNVVRWSLAAVLQIDDYDVLIRLLPCESDRPINVDSIAERTLQDIVVHNINISPQLVLCRLDSIVGGSLCLTSETMRIICESVSSLDRVFRIDAGTSGFPKPAIPGNKQRVP